MGSNLIDSTNTLTVRTFAAQALGRIGLPESIAALAKANREKSSSFHSLSTAALLNVLSPLTPDHYGKLDRETVPNLCHLLLTDRRPDILLQILEAVEKIGDARAVLPVQQLTKLPYPSEVRTMAKRILPLLLTRQEQENHHSMLLRGSEAPTSSGVELLRAVHKPISETDPVELLRATHQEE